MSKINEVLSGVVGEKAKEIVEKVAEEAASKVFAVLSEEMSKAVTKLDLAKAEALKAKAHLDKAVEEHRAAEIAAGLSYEKVQEFLKEKLKGIGL